MTVWRLSWQFFPMRTGNAWHCPRCRKAEPEFVATFENAAQPGDLTACPGCLAPLRVGAGRFHKIRDSGITRLTYEHPTIALELLALIEQYNQAKVHETQGAPAGPIG